jgi:hypothetical protein
MRTAHDVVAACSAAAEARNWQALGDLAAADVLYRGPQAREQVRGRQAYLRFNAEGFPAEWHVAARFPPAGRPSRLAAWPL